jgi:glycerophosphoryl diester phosphodiesterase
MRPAAPGSPWAHPRAQPYVIGHRGNSRDEIERFVERGADFVEVDLWVHHGQFESRHERALYPLPILFEKWYLKRRSPAFDLALALDQLAGRAWLFLDLKNGGEAVVPLVAEALRRFPAMPIAASGSDWGMLRALSDRVPNVDVFYSMAVIERLDLFYSVVGRDARPIGVSCRAELLTRDVVDELHEMGIRVIAWTVDQVDRARRLANWGVDAITTHRPAEVRAILGP